MVRNIGRIAALFFFATAPMYYLLRVYLYNSNGADATFWFLIGAGVIALALIFRGWPQVIAWIGHGARRAAPHVQAGGQAVINRARAGGRFAAPHVRRGGQFALAKLLAFLVWGVKKLFTGAIWLFNRIGKFLGKALSGGYERDVAAITICILSGAVLMVAAAVGSQELAFLAGIAAIGGFIAFVVLCINDRTSIKNMK